VGIAIAAFLLMVPQVARTPAYTAPAAAAPTLKLDRELQPRR
jgi:hypothetical protein